MKNLINEIKSISEKEIKSFGITEIFVVNNETSHAFGELTISFLSKILL